MTKRDAKSLAVVVGGVMIAGYLMAAMADVGPVGAARSGFAG